MKHAALVVIDMQQDLCCDVRRADKVEEMLPTLHRAVDLFYQHQQPVIYTQMLLPIDDAQFKRFGDRYCIEGTAGAELIKQVYPLRGPVVTKRKHSAFFETELDDLLRRNAVETVFLAGLQTQICIMTTAADANFRGYRPIVIEDCVVSTRDPTKQAALEWIAKYVGEVRPFQELAKEIADDS
jgi:nicotinamidase-related amidase